MDNLLLFSKDILIAKFINENFEVINYDLLPLFLKNTHNVVKWLESRAIDNSRANARILKRTLGLYDAEDYSIVLSVNGATITDNYWVKNADDDIIDYDTIRFKYNAYSNVALNGDLNGFILKPSRTPELTNIGSFEKCWIQEENKWWLYKKGSNNALFSELLVYELGKALGLNMAFYKSTDKYIKSLDFTDNAIVNFEPAIGVITAPSNYISSYNEVYNLNKSLIGDYIKMCYLDALILNPDRHKFNFGFLRDINNGNIISMAPLYDHNLCLISTGYPTELKHNDPLITDFCDLLKFNSIPFNVIKLTEDIVRDKIRSVTFIPDVTDAVNDPISFVVDFIMNRQKSIFDKCSSLINFL